MEEILKIILLLKRKERKKNRRFNSKYKIEYLMIKYYL